MNETFKTKLKAIKACGSIVLENKKEYVVVFLDRMRGALTKLDLKEKDIVEVTLKKVKK